MTVCFLISKETICHLMSQLGFRLCQFKHRLEQIMNSFVCVVEIRVGVLSRLPALNTVG